MPALKDKVILVVGGTTGIGLSAARAALQEGARGVVIVGRDPKTCAEALTTLGERARCFTGDAMNPTTVEAAISLALAEFGALDGLYHVAGGSGRKFGDGPLHEMTDEGWAKTLEWNLTSAIYSSRAAVRTFLAQGRGGSILLAGSVLGYSPSPAFFCTHAYATAKAGLIGFAKSVAARYAENAIRVNVLAPALVATPMSQRAAGDEQVLQFIKSKQPLDGGRIGQPADLDAAAVYFLSDASAFCTGQVLAVDGGWGVTEGQVGSG